MKCRLLRDMACDKHPKFPTGIRKAGSVINHPDAYQLVRMGVAQAEDEECAAKVGMTPEELAEAAKAYERVSRGIHPDDYAAYDAGKMIGYNPDGSWKPGPNYVPGDEDGEDLDDEDELPDDET